MKIEFSGEVITIEKCDDCYIGTISNLTGVNAQGDTFEECLESAKEALVLIREANNSFISAHN